MLERVALLSDKGGVSSPAVALDVTQSVRELAEGAANSRSAEYRVVLRGRIIVDAIAGI